MSSKIPLYYFKTHCLEMFDNLQTSQNSIAITKRNKPIAEVTAINPKRVSLFGLLRHKAEIKTNIIEPIDNNWDAENE